MADRTARGSGVCGIVLALCTSLVLAGCVSTQEPAGRAPEVTERRDAPTTGAASPTPTSPTHDPHPHIAHPHIAHPHDPGHRRDERLQATR
jgi:hypothetical protein